MYIELLQGGHLVADVLALADPGPLRALLLPGQVRWPRLHEGQARIRRPEADVPLQLPADSLQRLDLLPAVPLLAERQVQLGVPACRLLGLRGRRVHGRHRLVVLLLQVHWLHGHILHGCEAQVQPDDHPPRGAPRHDARRRLVVLKVSSYRIDIIILITDNISHIGLWAADIPHSSCSSTLVFMLSCISTTSCLASVPKSRNICGGRNTSPACSWFSSSLGVSTPAPHSSWTATIPKCMLHSFSSSAHSFSPYSQTFTSNLM